MRTMYDAVTAANIPTDATLVAGYIDANFAWSDADWARFPHATLVRITVYPWTNDGHVIDIEPGNWEPPDAPGWCRMRRAAGMTPTVYTMRDWWQWCIDEFNRQGEPQPLYWIADWDGEATLPPGAVAKQYANSTMLGNTGYDLNVVADYWPGVDKEEDMDAQQAAQLAAVHDALLGWYPSRIPGDDNQTRMFDLAYDTGSWNAQTLRQTRANNATLAALTEAVAALSQDSTLTADEVERIVRDAVEQNIQISGTVTVTGQEGGTA